jgi:hypothetical protein
MDTPPTHGANKLSLWTGRRPDLPGRTRLAGDDAGGEFLPETPLEAAARRIESVLTILDDWDDWTTDWAAPQKNWRPPNSVSKLRRPTLSARRPAWSRSKLNRARWASLS